MNAPPVRAPLASLPKTPTGNAGLDEILDGGVPKGRPTLVCGTAGCGKTLLGMQFLVRGALDYDEPGVFIAFEETPEDLQANVASLGFDLIDLERRQLLSIDHIRVDPSEIVESGEYDLSALFVRLGLAIDSVKAQRVVIDTLETLFGGLSNYAVVRAELRRLFEWLKERGVTAIITAERGDNALTRHGLEEYVSDCVIVLDHRVTDQVSTRRMRVVKYRGSVHGTNEYPFLIDREGLAVLPITSAGLDHQVSDERISTGVARLDSMVGGGIYRGTTMLVSGSAGTGKSSIVSHMVNAACSAGERVIHFSFEESPDQIVRNMRTIGIDLAPWVQQGLLNWIAARPTAHGIETHLALAHQKVLELDPKLIVFDPVSALMNAGDQRDASRMLVRLIDFLKGRGITAVLTALTSSGDQIETSGTEISSIVDVWLLLKTIEVAGERNRGLYVMKARGTDHSNQIREFRITTRGVELVDVYVGLTGVLTGSARANQEARDRNEAAQKRRLLEQKRRTLARLEALHREQLEKMRTEYEASVDELSADIDALEQDRDQLASDEGAMASRRKAD